MMGSRGGAPLQQADTLVVISEWMELMKGAGKALPAAVAQYKGAKEEAEAALERVDVARRELAGERAVQQKKEADLDRRDRQLVTDEAVISATRERLQQVSEEAASALSLNERLHAKLNEKLAGIEAQRQAAKTDIRNAKAALNAELDAARAEWESEKQAAQVAIEDERGKALDVVARHLKKAEEALRERATIVTRREEAVAAREIATREHAAALAALAQE